MHSTSIRVQETGTPSGNTIPTGDSSSAERLGPVADVVRRTYFGDCAELASRFGVSLEDVFDHCEVAFDLDLLDTPLLRRAAADRIAAHLDDLILAIACIADDSQAWFEFESDLQLSLARMCELRVGEIEASLQAARYLRSVRDRTRRLDPEFDDDDGYSSTASTTTTTTPVEPTLGVTVRDDDEALTQRPKKTSAGTDDSDSECSDSTFVLDRFVNDR